MQEEELEAEKAATKYKEAQENEGSQIDNMQVNGKKVGEYSGTQGEHNWTRVGDHISCNHCDEEYDIGDSYDYTCGGTATTTILGTESGIKQGIVNGYFEVYEKLTDSSTGNQTISRDEEIFSPTSPETSFNFILYVFPPSTET